MIKNLITNICTESSSEATDEEYKKLDKPTIITPNRTVQEPINLCFFIYDFKKIVEKANVVTIAPPRSI
jgi:hypothetical protein